MKIIILNTYNKSYLSDFFVEFGKQLSSSGHEVVIVSLKGVTASRAINSRFEIKIFKKRNKFSNYITIYKVLKKEKPDVVISNFSYVNPAVLASKLLSVSHNIIWFHTLKSQMNFKASNIYIKSKFMDLASCIITNSKELKDEVTNSYKQTKNKVYNLPFTTTVNIVDVKSIELVKEKGKLYLGCPGRIHPDKNQGLLIELLSVLKAKNIVLVFAGSSTERIIETHELYATYERQIMLLGTLSKSEMVDFYNKMDVIILPSFNEAFGLVFIEALAMGSTTLVSSRFGALHYIKEDVSSLVFNPYDVTDLKYKLETALRDKKTAKYYQSLYANNFSMNEIVQRFLDLLNK
ncbi:glycosyltransferase family 4 protein [Winogradskyella sediminis]|uniref:glycosyltransferase family 4 protein n=1 Tax=Winogradskyella sediminis TaxID=1382466 RepID=UPI000E2544DD|nr:glycosyltransferase family 4 protein [Winogradskyella sediminis]REG87734.1 glycosyltransferase involved in cell wall biosynthesis [Winogradskyella sediminis]